MGIWSCHLVLLQLAVTFPSSSSGVSKGAIAGIVLGAVAGAVTLSALVTLLILRLHMKKQHAVSRRRQCEYIISLIWSNVIYCDS